MYLHLGEKTVINVKDIIGIYDMDNVTVMKSSRDYLAAAEKSGDVFNVSMELPRSFVVCRDKTRKSGRVVYICQLSPTTLLKRTGYVDRLSLIKK